MLKGKQQENKKILKWTKVKDYCKQFVSAKLKFLTNKSIQNMQKTQCNLKLQTELSCAEMQQQTKISDLKHAKPNSEQKLRSLTNNFCQISCHLAKSMGNS